MEGNVSKGDGVSVDVQRPSCRARVLAILFGLLDLTVEILGEIRRCCATVLASVAMSVPPLAELRTQRQSIGTHVYSTTSIQLFENHRRLSQGMPYRQRISRLRTA
jgi:hypothetical protein